MRLALVFLTYGGSEARREYTYQTIHSVLDKIRYTAGELAVHIADDGSPEPHVKVCAEIAGGYEIVKAVTTSDSQRGGYGKNYNLATQRVHDYADVVLPVEDDWVLEEPLDLDPFVAALFEEGPSAVGCIRLGYIGFTREGGLRGSMIHRADRTYLLLDPDSEEPHVFAGHPRIERVDWQRRVGPWPEGEEPGKTEFLVCHNPNARIGIAWPLDFPATGIFQHIGSVRSTE